MGGLNSFIMQSLRDSSVRRGAELGSGNAMWGRTQTAQLEKDSSWGSGEYEIDLNAAAFGLTHGVSPVWSLGVGFALNDTDIDFTGRSAEADGYSLFAEAKLRYGGFYGSLIAAYSAANWDEEAFVGAHKISSSRDVSNLLLSTEAKYPCVLTENLALTPVVGYDFSI